MCEIVVAVQEQDKLEEEKDMTEEIKSDAAFESRRGWTSPW